MLNTRLPVLFLLSFLAGCTVTGPADDGYENSNEWVDNGRLLSGKTKTVYNNNQQNSKPSNSDADYVSYQQWLEAKDNNSGEYQKFKKWQEFEEFQLWKEQQKSE